MGTGAGHKAHSALITSQLSGQEEVQQKKVESAKMSVHDSTNVKTDTLIIMTEQFGFHNRQ